MRASEEDVSPTRVGPGPSGTPPLTLNELSEDCRTAPALTAGSCPPRETLVGGARCCALPEAAGSNRLDSSPQTAAGRAPPCGHDSCPPRTPCSGWSRCSSRFPRGPVLTEARAQASPAPIGLFAITRLVSVYRSCCTFLSTVRKRVNQSLPAGTRRKEFPARRDYIVTNPTHLKRECIGNDDRGNQLRSEMNPISIRYSSTERPPSVTNRF